MISTSFGILATMNWGERGIHRKRGRPPLLPFEHQPAFIQALQEEPPEIHQAEIGKRFGLLPPETDRYVRRYRRQGIDIPPRTRPRREGSLPQRSDRPRRTIPAKEHPFPNQFGIFRRGPKRKLSPFQQEELLEALQDPTASYTKLGKDFGVLGETIRNYANIFHEQGHLIPNRSRRTRAANAIRQELQEPLQPGDQAKIARKYGVSPQRVSQLKPR